MWKLDAPPGPAGQVSMPCPCDLWVPCACFADLDVSDDKALLAGSSTHRVRESHSASTMSRRLAEQLRELNERQHENADRPRSRSRSREDERTDPPVPGPTAAGRGRGRAVGGRTDVTGTGRGRGRPRRPSPPPPGHESYNVTNMFSITASQLDGNCPSAWLGQHKLFALFCLSTWFAFSLELGTRRAHKTHALFCAVETSSHSIAERARARAPGGNAR